MSGKHAGSLLALAMVLAICSPASAQVYIGGDGLPANQIDQSVLDSLGTPVSLSEMFMGGRAPTALAMPAAFTSPSQAPTARRLKHQKSFTLIEPKAPRHGNVTVTTVKADKPIATVKPEKVQAETPAPSDMTEEAPAPTVAHAPRIAETAPAKVLPMIVPKAEPAKAEPLKAEPKVEKAPEVVAAKPAPVAPAPTPAPAAPVVASVAPTPLTPEPAPTPASAPVVVAPPPAPAPAPVVVAPPPAPVAPTPVAPAAVIAMPAPAPAAVPVAPPLAAPAPQQAYAPVPAVAPVGLGDGGATISFEKDAAHLQPGALSTLAAMANRMAKDDGLQVQLLAYADGDEDSAGKARRLSLSRALAVRSYLIDQGVRSTRIEVRALGNKVPDGPPDRVDVVVQRH